MGMQPLCMLLVLMTFTSCSIAQTTVLPMNESTVVTVMETMILLSTFAPELPAPENVTAVAIDTTSFMVTWDILIEDDSISYDMDVSSTSNTSDQEALLNVTSGITIDEKTPGDQYEVIVYSILDGQNTSSTPTHIRLSPEIVKNLRDKDDGEVVTSYVEVEWEKPDGIIDEYGMNCSQGEPQQSSLDKTATSGICDKVVAGANITVTVWSVSGLKVSRADSTIVTAYPNIVANLSSLPSTLSSVSVSWMRPMGELDYYAISCSSGGATPEMISADEGSEFNASCSGDNVTAGLTVNVNITTVSGSKGNPFFINATAEPNPVANLREESVTTESVTASWEYPAGDVTEYNVSCSSGDASPPTLAASDDVTSYKASCVNLNVPGGDYTITVISISEGVAGESVSIPITAQPNPPILVEDSSTVDSVSVRWPHPDGVVDYYLVDCKEGMPENANITAIVGELIATCNVETPGDNYTIYVTSVSNGQLSSQSSQSVIANPEVVQNLLEVDNGIVTSYVEVKWDPPAGFIDGYEMNCSQGDPQYSSLNETGICNNTDAGANITVTVWSVSGVKVSRTNSTIVTAYPNIVANLSSLPSTSSSVSVEWDKPDGELTRYLVSCSDGVPSAESINDNGDENLNVDCNDVTAGRSVTVTVTTESGSKQNPTNISVESAPGAVVELTEDNATTNSVTVSWKLPEDQKPTYQYVVESSDNNATCNTTESNTAATCAPVTAGSLITVTVTTVSGKLNSSDDINVRAVPNEVSDVTIGEPTTDSVSVSWKKPMGELDSYEVTCSSGDANPEIISADKGSEFNASCTDGVTAGLTVTVNITTVSGSKGNPFFIDATAKPNPAASLTEKSVTPNSVTASWEDPAGDVTEYNVSCSSGDASPPAVSASDDVTSYNASCVNLNVPGGDYTITVTSISEGVAGESVSIPITAQPNPPLLKELSSTVDSVSVRWPHPYGVVDYYLVDCEEGMPENANITAIIGELIATCNVTTPGDNYTIYVTSVSNGQLSSQSGQSVTAIPESVKTLSVDYYNSESVTLIWEIKDNCANEGCVWSGYSVNYTRAEGNDSGECMPGKNDTRINITSLMPGSLYNFLIYVVSEDEQSSEETASQRLRPASVTSATPISYRNSITITWDKPSGIVTDYQTYITDTITGESNGDLVHTPEVEFRELVAFRNYNVTICSKSGEEECENVLKLTIQTLPDKPPTPSSTESPVANKPVTALKSFTVEFSPTVFSHCNGEINNYTVIVVESGAYDSEADKPISAEGSPPPTKTFNEVSSKKPLGEYQAFAPKPYPYPWSIEDCKAGSSRRRRQTTMLEVIIIGDGSSSGDYTNGELHSNRKYKVKFRIMNEVGYADSIYSDEIETDLHPAAWLVPLLFGLFLILLILIILIILKERREPGSVRRRMPWVNGGIENPAFVEDKPMRRTGDKRPVKLANFGIHLEEMEKDSDYLFSEEYNDLRPVGKNQADDTAKLECNKSKNRFSNILPYDHTRVKLSPAEDEPGSDYINANYMVGAKSSREYIACQGPLQNTEEDMWRMVWEQSASLIVMVTQLMEGNKIKCHQYWCQEGEGPVRYGDIIVKNIATEQNDLWVVRKFSLTKGPITREVLHFNFTAWPDHGVPESPDHLIKFVQAVRRVKKNDGKPIVVHCSAGVGRTGTFIALDTLMSQMETSDEVDIFGLIRSMRMNRCLMVQTEIQYVYIHQCIMALLEGDDENAYENYNGTTDSYYNEALI